MGYSSTFSTPGSTPLRLQLIESSSPWSDILLQEQTFHAFSSPIRESPIRIGTFNHAPGGTRKTRFRRYHRALWLAIFLVVGSLGFWIGKRSTQSRNKVNKLSIPSIEGLQFIDVNHPGLRV